MENFEKGAVVTPEQEKPEQEKQTEQAEFVPAEEIKPEIVADIKREDAGGIENAQAEIREFAKQEKSGEAGNEKFLQLAGQKLDEIQEVVNSRKKGLFNKLLYSEKDFTLAEAAINKAKQRISGGNLPDMRTVINSESLRKFAGSVDVSEFPEREGKKYSGPASTGGKMMSNF